ncbi:MAG: LytTR family transcriptional regulator DNA-binding domain-containing protein, partial [Bacteroidales bacterium]
NIKQYDDILTHHGFFRCHQSHIINVSFIKRYHKVEGGSLILKVETSIPVSLRKKMAMFKFFQEQGL